MVYLLAGIHFTGSPEQGRERRTPCWAQAVGAAGAGPSDEMNLLLLGVAVVGFLSWLAMVTGVLELAAELSAVGAARRRRIQAMNLGGEIPCRCSASSSDADWAMKLWWPRGLDSAQPAAQLRERRRIGHQPQGLRRPFVTRSLHVLLLRTPVVEPLLSFWGGSYGSCSRRACSRVTGERPRLLALRVCW